MDFLSEREFGRRFRAALRARTEELRRLGSSASAAAAQARKEFAVYDLIVVDDQGRIRVEGLDLPPVEEEAG